MPWITNGECGFVVDGKISHRGPFTFISYTDSSMAQSWRCESCKAVGLASPDGA